MDDRRNSKIIRRWLWPPQQTYRPSDRLILISTAIVGLLAAFLAVQFVIGLNARPSQRRPVNATTAPNTPHVATITAIAPPARAMSVIVAGCEASIDHYWHGVPLAVGATTGPLRNNAPRVAATVVGAPQIISSTADVVVAQVLVDYRGKQYHVTGRAQRLHAHWVFVPA